MTSTSDIVIIGGGLMGLAIALDLSQHGASVTVLERDRTQAAGYAAAGMLAPQAEGIPPGPLLDLSLWSRDLYSDWASKLEALSGQPVGYWPCGILRPLMTPSVAPPTGVHQWLDYDAIRLVQPGLSEAVMGGWWLPEDGQVDNQAMMRALLSALEAKGVTIQTGVDITSLPHRHGQITTLHSPQGSWSAGHYILATGAWAAELLPVPVQPRKGEMLSLLPGDRDRLPLRRVLFGDDVYIVPRQDGRIIIGATSESVGFQPGNTVAGVHALLDRALALLPSLADRGLGDRWWGFRPTTPDEAPILGASPWDNLSLAVGHHRNGVLLAPATAHILRDWVLHRQAHPLLPSFSWQRFLTPSSDPAASDRPSRSLTHSATPVMSSTSTRPDSATSAPASTADSPLVIAGRTFQSRLMTGTGKYRSLTDMQGAIAASGCDIVTVAVRRVQTNAPGHEGLADAIDWNRIWMLPNTAGCKTADEAIRVARLGREMAKLLGQEDNNFIKLEVIPDSKYLLPDPIGTLEAAEQLVKEGFAVLPYINADPLLAKRLEDIGCATVMPLGSPIGSGQGIRNTANIQIIIENATIPVVVDAGIGTPSEAAQAMEMGADALLINTAIAQAQNPALMGQAMGMAAQAGRMAYLAGRIPIQSYAIASSPTTGTVV
jgi:thiazole synthase